MSPNDTHVLIPRTCEYYLMWPPKKGLCRCVYLKNPESRGYSGRP